MDHWAILALVAASAFCVGAGAMGLYLTWTRKPPVVNVVNDYPLSALSTALANARWVPDPHASYPVPNEGGYLNTDEPGERA